MTTWTDAFIQSLVTDSGSLRDGQKLANTGVWSHTGRNEDAAWGLIQGSGKNPYQVCINFSTYASKCTCPSRKFPCKHAAGLMVLLSRDSIAQSTQPPDWVASWIEGLARKREAAAAPPAPPKPVDAAAKAKRDAARQSKVDAGVAELRMFLEDLARQGFAQQFGGGERPQANNNYAYWDRIASRMVDAQMSSVARRLRALAGLPFQKQSDWVGRMADEIGRLYALTEAYLRIDTLSEDLAHDVRSALGFSLKTEEVLWTGAGVLDSWSILGQATVTEEDLLVRRTWLYGETTQRWSLLLDFAHASRPAFERQYPVGQRFEGELVYYPSAYPQRAVVKGVASGYTTVVNLPDMERVETLLDVYAEALAQNPFIERVFGGLRRAYPTRAGLHDQSGARLPLTYVPNLIAAWVGGDWLPVFGEWDGEAFMMTNLVTSDGWLAPGDTP
jgi:hypothetical protein